VLNEFPGLLPILEQDEGVPTGCLEHLSLDMFDGNVRFEIPVQFMWILDVVTQTGILERLEGPQAGRAVDQFRGADVLLQAVAGEDVILDAGGVE